MCSNNIIRYLLVIVMVALVIRVDCQNFPDVFGLYPAPDSIIRDYPIVLKSASPDKKVLDVPKYLWSYGCTPTALGMLVAYYDINLFPSLYPEGTAPMTNCGWDCIGNMGKHPLIATKKGLAGRTTLGHVDDYWDSTSVVGNKNPDPYIVANRSPHSDDCIADYLGTSRSINNIGDGGTNVWSFPDSSKCYMSSANGLALKYGAFNFFKDRRVVLKELYTQNYEGRVKDGSAIVGGFTFEDYKSEIDNGWPILIHFKGHTTLGVGYDISSGTNKMIIHDTWSTSATNTVIWGGSLPCGSKRLQMMYVTVVHPTNEPLGAPSCIGCGASAPASPIINSLVFDSLSNSSVLSWTDGSNNGYDVDYYAIYRCSGNNNISVDGLIAYTENNYFKDNYNGFIPDSVYKYAVAAVGYEAESANSATHTVVVGISESSTIYGKNISEDIEHASNNIFLKKVHVENCNVSFDINNSFEIVSDFSIDVGSTLEIK